MKIRAGKRKRQDGLMTSLPGRLDVNGEQLSSKQCEKLANHNLQTRQTVSNVRNSPTTTYRPEKQ